MDRGEFALIFSLAATNIVAGLGFAVAITVKLIRLTNKSHRFLRYYLLVVGIYFIECIAFMFGMCTQIFTVSLSFVWAALFGLWLRRIAPAEKIIKTCLFVALYGCVPTVSFAFLLLVIWVWQGNGLLNAEQAGQFGIPDFMPWPLNTMLGFCLALAAGTILLKILITTGTAKWLIRRAVRTACVCTIEKETAKL